MARLTQKGDKYIGSFQGAAGRFAYVEIALSHEPAAEIDLYPVICKENDLTTEPEKILQAVIDGVCATNRELKSDWHLLSVGYLPTDSKYYTIHQMLTQSIIRQIESGMPFEKA